MSRRVVVIGAGHNGLVAAIRLAERGCDVVVVEASGAPGGGVRSSGELTLPGFVHDVCSAFYPLAAASPAFRSLGLNVEWVNPDVPMVHVLDGGAVALHRDLDATCASLEACARGAGAAWGSLVTRLMPHRDALVHAALGRFPPLLASARLVGVLRGGALELAPLALASSASLGLRLFGDERAAAWLASSGAHADVSPYASGSGAFSLGLNFLGHAVGWPFPRGGAGRLTDALVARLGSLGGSVRCGCAVAGIETGGEGVGRLAGMPARGRRFLGRPLARARAVRATGSRRVVAVRLSNEERLEADAVICTASPAVLMSLLPAGSLPGRVSRRLQGWRYGLGTLKLDYALSGPMPWLSPDARRAGVVQVGGPLSEVALSLGDALAGRVPERPALVVGQQSLFDRTRVPDGGGGGPARGAAAPGAPGAEARGGPAPAGAQTLYVYARVPQDCGEPAVAAVEEQLERFAPGFRSLVLARSVRTPAAIEAENPSMRGGDLASGSFELDQQLIFRPDARLFRYRTPLRGLYVAGAWVHPGAGVHGMSGRNAADTLLRDLRLRRL